MKKMMVLTIFPLFMACNNHVNSDQVKQEDSMNNVSDHKVDSLLMNDDSLIKAKEAELLKKYN